MEMKGTEWIEKLKEKCVELPLHDLHLNKLNTTAAERKTIKGKCSFH
jgi:hypothetical protein